MKMGPPCWGVLGLALGDVGGKRKSWFGERRELAVKGMVGGVSEGPGDSWHLVTACKLKV